MKRISEAIVDRLLTYMGERNLTQYKLSQISGVPFPTLKSIMQGRTKDISLKTVIMLAEGLGLKVSEFLDSENFQIQNLIIE